MFDFLPAAIILVFVGVYLIGALLVEKRFVPPRKTILIGYVENATVAIQKAIDAIDKFGEGMILLTARIYEIDAAIKLKPGVTLSGLGPEETYLRTEKK